MLLLAPPLPNSVRRTDCAVTVLNAAGAVACRPCNTVSSQRRKSAHAAEKYALSSTAVYIPFQIWSKDTLFVDIVCTRIIPLPASPRDYPHDFTPEKTRTKSRLQTDTLPRQLTPSTTT